MFPSIWFGPQNVATSVSSRLQIGEQFSSSSSTDDRERVSSILSIGEQNRTSSSSTIDYPAARAVVQWQIDRMNTSSVGGGLSPHELIHGTPTMDSHDEPNDAPSDEDGSHPPASPPSKRLRSSTEDSGSDSGGKTLDSSPWLAVTRRERADLLKKFKAEQKLDRRRFKLEVRATWEAEIADNKENCLHEGDSREDSSLPRWPVDPEDAAEAYENYLFDRLQRYDGDSAAMLVDFRSSLTVVPSWNVQQERINPALMQNRTAALWEGLRRVYFGEKELEPSRDDLELSHEEVMDNLRREIAEVEERLRTRRPPPDSGRDIPPLPRDHDDDEGGPPRSIAHTNVDPVARSGGVLVAYATVPGTPPPSTSASGPAEAAYCRNETCLSGPIRKLVFLSKRVLRRIMAAKESLFKFGTFVPKNDREAGLSPEAARWKAGRDLEWVRLGKEGTFDGD